MDDRGSSTARARGARRREPRGEARPGRAAPRGGGGTGRAPSPDARGIVQEDIPEGRRGAGGVLSACVRCQLETRERHLTADDSLRADLISRDLAHSTAVCWSAFLHHVGEKKNAQSSVGCEASSGPACLSEVFDDMSHAPPSSLALRSRYVSPSLPGYVTFAPKSQPAHSGTPPSRRARRCSPPSPLHLAMIFPSRAAAAAPLAPRRPTHPPFHPRRRHRSLTRAEHHEPRREDPRARYGTITSPLVSSSPRVATRRRLSETKRARTTHTHATFGFLRFSFSKLASILAYLDLSRESK